jgi:hypothetical protein
MAGLVDQAADFAGRLGDIDQQHVPATVTSSLGMRGSSPCPMGPARCSRVRPR